MTAFTETTCPYCGVGCGIRVDQQGAVQGDKRHPANRGALCVKGTALTESQRLPSRLLYPRIKGKEVDWPAAIEHIALRLNDIIEQHGPEAVAFTARARC
ncbi:hypothetical protein MBH78_02395 [Oceanimonas sp. NS1]|nr:hypothetical protein [Oceanimonas sp. NS1]